MVNNCHSERLVKNLIRSFVATLLRMTVVVLLFTSPAYAKDCDPNDAAAIAKFGPCPSGLDQIEQVFTNVISMVVGLGFTALLILLVWAGIKYLTSGGEPKAIQSAHQTVTWAFLGVIFMAIAWIVLQLIKVFTGIDVTIFNIKILI